MVHSVVDIRTLRVAVQFLLVADCQISVFVQSWTLEQPTEVLCACLYTRGLHALGRLDNLSYHDHAPELYNLRAP